MNISPQGYYRIWINGKAHYFHRVLIERKLKRKLLRTEHIHHIDGNKLNNAIKNLAIVSLGKHNSIHKKKQKVFNGKKECTKCNKWLLVKENFGFQKKEDRWARWCKKCASEYQRSYKQKF